MEQLRERGVETLWGTVNRRNRPSRIMAHILGFHSAGELVRFEVLGGRWKWRVRSSFEPDDRA